MGFGTMFKANRAYRAQKNGNEQEAARLYEECFNEGLNDARYVLAYAVLLIRSGQYQKAKDFLVKNQKAAGMTPEQRVNLIVDYSACCFRLGELDKAILKLEELHRKGPKSLIYQTLGYLYTEKYESVKKPDFEALAREKAAEQSPDSVGEGGVPEGENASAGPEKEPALSPEEEWNAGIEKARAFNEEAVEYDDEDPICLDNMGQFLYRVMNDRESAKPWFEKAHREKPEQIDTLYFLSRYDLEAGDRSAALEKLEKALEGRFSPLNYCDRAAIETEIAKLKGEG